MMFVVVIHNKKVTELYEESDTFDSALRYISDKYRLSDEEVIKFYENGYLIDGPKEFYIGRREDV